MKDIFQSAKAANPSRLFVGLVVAMLCCER